MKLVLKENSNYSHLQIQGQILIKEIPVLKSGIKNLLETKTAPLFIDLSLCPHFPSEFEESLTHSKFYASQLGGQLILIHPKHPWVDHHTLDEAVQKIEEELSIDKIQKLEKRLTALKELHSTLHREFDSLDVKTQDRLTPLYNVRRSEVLLEETLKLIECHQKDFKDKKQVHFQQIPESFMKNFKAAIQSELKLDWSL